LEDDLKRALAFLLLAALLTSACNQNDGEPCQVDDDCGDGLTCCIGVNSPRGICGTEDDAVCEPSTEDASTPIDDDDAGEPN
jgi:hypothetical protein